MVLEFIRNNSNWREILSGAPYNLIIKDDGIYTILKYNQIESDFSNAIVRECRGLIIKFEENEPVIVCRPFDKFFNFGETFAAEINWNHVVITEKIDGSLMKVWWDQEWHLSTNGTIDAYKAPLQTLNSIDSYGELFNSIVNWEELISKLNRENTYMFEMVSPFSTVVIPYSENEVYYLGARNNETGEYVEEDLDCGCPVPQQKEFDGLLDVIKYTDNLSWMNEGYVVFDGVNRIKVKSPAYVRAHYYRANNNITWKHLFEIVEQGEDSEFLSYFPSMIPLIEEIKEYNIELKNTAIEILRRLKKQEPMSRAEYAVEVKAYHSFFWDFLFRNYDGYVLFEDWYKGVKLSKKIDFFLMSQDLEHEGVWARAQSVPSFL